MLAIVGLLVLIVIVPIGSYWQRSRLETTAGDIRNFLQSAYSEAINQHTQILVQLQTDAVTGRWELQLFPPPPPPRTASGTLLLPDFVSFADNPAATAGGWPILGAFRGITCDPSGRTMVPPGFAGSTVETAGQPVLEVKTLAVTHANMVDGSLQPNTRFDIQLYPVWTIAVRKVIL